MSQTGTGLLLGFEKRDKFVPHLLAEFALNSIANGWHNACSGKRETQALTRNRLQLVFVGVIVFYLLLIVVFFGIDPDGPLNTQLKTTLPLLVAIPAAILVESFRRYRAFQSALIELYYSIVDDLQTAILYTKKIEPTEEEYFKTLSDLSRSIDRIRAHFSNIPQEGKGEGYYPFEGVKTFYQWIEYLGAGDQWQGAEAADRTRAAIIHLWKFKVRDPLLTELDRHIPTEIMSPYLGDDMWRMPPERYLTTAIPTSGAETEK